MSIDEKAFQAALEPATNDHFSKPPLFDQALRWRISLYEAAKAAKVSDQPVEKPALDENERYLYLKSLTEHLPPLPAIDDRAWFWSDQEINILRAACARRFGETLRTESLFSIAATGIRLFLHRKPKQECVHSLIEMALQKGAKILADFKPEGERNKVEEWEACYAMLFKQLNDAVQEIRRLQNIPCKHPEDCDFPDCYVRPRPSEREISDREDKC